MLAPMANQEQHTKKHDCDRAAERVARSLKRERQFEHLVGKALETAFAVAKFLYIQIEDIKARLEMTQEQLETMENTLGQIEAEDDALLTAVQDAGGELVSLVKEIQGLPQSGGSITEAQVEALNTRAQQTLSKMTDATNTLTAATAQAKTDDPGATSSAGSGGSDEEPQTGSTGSGDTSKPNKSVYVFTGAGEPDLTDWTASGFETDDTPPVPLYYFDGDLAGTTETNGQGVGAWALYTGAFHQIATA